MATDLVTALSLDLPAFVIGIGIHEFCHAFAADRLGDPTPREQGRVSLNRIEHLDLMGTVLPLYLSLMRAPIAFGWGKPVQIDTTKFKHPLRDYGIVAAAGPFGNLLVCVLVGLFLRSAFSIVAVKTFMTTPTGNFCFRLLFKIFALNLGLMLFNLVPIPPLDGSKIFMWLGDKELMEKIQPYGLIFLILFISTGLDSKLLVPAFIHLTIWLTGPMAKYVFFPDRFVADFL